MLPVNAFAVLPAYRQVNLFNDNDELIAPIELLCLDNSLMVTVHPSAAQEVKEQLLTLVPAEAVSLRFLNNFRVFSKQACLQHLYNVLEPLAADSQTKSLLSAFEKSDFDSNLLQSGQSVVLNLAQINTDFRMNERIFRD